MGRSLIQVVDPSAQTVAQDGIINLGSVLRRYGCNCRLSGNAVEISGEGYYEVNASVALAPTAEGEISVTLYKDGAAVPGAVAYATAAAAGDSVTVPITATIRQGCLCEGASQLTLVLGEGAATVRNVSVRVVKG